MVIVKGYLVNFNNSRCAVGFLVFLLFQKKYSFEKTQKFFKRDRLKARFKFDTASAVVFQNTFQNNLVT